MKVGITGHTSGIGLALAKVFPDHIGFSRANGYDILLPDAREQIVNEVDECDVFLNNAHAGFGQQILLGKLWDKWRFQDKIIVCIGSRAADYTNDPRYPHYQYAIEKKALEDTCMYMNHARKPCKVICVKPAYVDTPAVRDVTQQKIDPNDLAVAIKQLVEMNKSFWIPKITIYPR